MLELFYLVGIVNIISYLYTAIMFGKVSWKARNKPGRVLVDALIWPIMGWTAIEDLYKA